MVVPEALSYGISVVVSNVYALPELVGQGKAGVIIAAGNVSALIRALDGLISDPQKRRRLSLAAKKHFEGNFSVGVSNKQLIHVYKQALTP